ncbi:branched-subunit amino acid transport protein [Halanaerobium saccharolyticum]|uniref:Branched-subunit amino acid transport protein n=1 Tax=Halanaerobium saccharolyticum TaxID=43595 RepID=A0A4R7ZBJ2_9FIRM|nr:AzlD domain-containing protein [Halanaerobium saccharolyticum]RAK11855.1 branched-subunit amino acid transport protein [Halanaerobium saccharolyticum]TDW07696.1 branched-subunit amino acid transport protein [Halanaerobium saccharolyticum]TDX64617.1 branched-subunit amino acid transport protein [Halanaerobium saccharolyticum]
MEIVKFMLMIVGMVIVTFIPRVLPLALLGKKELPEKVVLWLSFIPAAVLAALLAPSILLKNGSLYLSLENTSLIAFFPTLLVAYKTKSIFYTVSGGLIFYLLISFLF